MANRMKQLTSAAKQIRMKHPKMTWPNAIKAASKARGTVRKRKISGTMNKVVLSKSGTVAGTRRRKNSSSDGSLIGAVSINNPVKLGIKIGKLAVSMGAGVVATEMVLKPFIIRPLENFIAQKFPAATKFTPAIQIILGGSVVLMNKNQYIKAAGLGMLGVGVVNALQKTNLLNRVGDYTELFVPINGTETEMYNSGLVAGAITDNDVVPRSGMVAGVPGSNYEELSNSGLVAGDDWDMLLMPKYAM